MFSFSSLLYYLMKLDINIIVKEVENFLKPLNYFPTREYFLLNNKSLFYKIRSNKFSFKEIEKLCCIKYKHNMYSEKNIIEEVKLFAKNLGYFPSGPDFIENNQVKLLNKIRNNKLTLTNLEKNCLIKNKNKKLERINDIINEVNLFAKNLGYFPSGVDFIENGKIKLLNKIRTQKLTLTNLEKNCLIKRKNTKKHLGYWNEINILDTLKMLIKKLNKFPTKNDIFLSGNSGMISGMKQLGKNISYYRKILGFKERRKINGYWDNYKNLTYEIKKLIINEKSFPSLLKIELCLGSAAKKSVLKNGGILNISKKMGYKYIPRKTYRTSDGHFVHSLYEYLFDEFLFSRNIPHSVGGKVSALHNYKYDFKINDYLIEIWGFEKTGKSKMSISYNKKRQIKEKLYKDLNLNLISIEGTIFKRFKETIKDEFKKIIEKLNLNNSYPEIKEFSIKKSLNKFEKYDEGLIIKDLKEIIEKTGNFPTQMWLRNNKKNPLIEGIHRFGGLKHFKKIIENK